MTGRVVFWLLLLALATTAGTSQAQDPTGKYIGSPYASWFDAQVNGNGSSCCKSADGHRYIGDYQINADGSVTLKLATGDVLIAPFKVILTPEPPGLDEALLWYSGTGEPTADNTYCFHPSSLT